MLPRNLRPKELTNESTDVSTDVLTDDPTEVSTDVPTEPVKSRGCSSFVCIGAVAIMAIATAVVALKKKD